MTRRQDERRRTRDERRTRRVTLHRLSVPPPSDGLANLLEFLDTERISEKEEAEVDIADSPGLWVQGVLRTATAESAEWCDDAARTTNLNVALSDQRSLGLLLVVVDGSVFAIGYGQGQRLVPDERKDHRFGIAFAVRTFEALHLNALLRRKPGARGRTDATIAPAGLPIWGFGIEDHADLVGRVRGTARGLALTCTEGHGGAVRIDASAGLRLPLGVEPSRLKSDLEEISRICREEQPRADLEFVERVQPVADPTTIDDLDATLDGLLGQRTTDVLDTLTPVVPAIRIADYLEATSFRVRIHNWGGRTDQLELDDFLRFTRRLPLGTRLDALRRGHIQLYSDRCRREPLGPPSRAHLWLEANICVQERRFSSVDGAWYEVDAKYLKRIREDVERILSRPSSVQLPGWKVWASEGERTYNERVGSELPDKYLCLDRKGIKDKFHRRNGVEICDLLTREGALVHVKHAHGSAPLSHLFMQALVAVQTFRNSPEVRQRFAELASSFGPTWAISPEFEPARLVFAILLKDGSVVSPDTLFPFAQVALVHIDRVLGSLYGIDVEVVPIPGDTRAAPAVSGHLPAPRAEDASDQTQLSLFPQ